MGKQVMNVRPREKGRFASKSEADRQVRSIRATNRVWDDFGFLADQRRITRADLLEDWVKQSGTTGDTAQSAIAIALLKEALSLKANSGGAIKAKIKQALEYLEA